MSSSSGDLASLGQESPTAMAPSSIAPNRSELGNKQLGLRQVGEKETSGKSGAKGRRARREEGPRGWESLAGLRTPREGGA